MGTFSAPQHTHPGIFILELPLRDLITPCMGNTRVPLVVGAGGWRERVGVVQGHMAEMGRCCGQVIAMGHGHTVVQQSFPQLFNQQPTHLHTYIAKHANIFTTHRK